ncbi:MAG: DUF2490 domain-containing protein [Bacteroidota bacterium]
MAEELRLVLIIWIFSSLLIVSAQDDVDFQLWTNYALTVPIKKTPRFTYGGDVGVRGVFSNQDWNQILVRPTVRWRFDQVWSVSAAVANFTTFNQTEANVYEYRTHQQVNVRWPDLGWVSFFYRVRLEQRWFFYPDLPDDYKGRFRYLIGLETQDFRLGEGKRPFYFRAMWEGFNTLNEEEAAEIFLNNARLHGAFGHRLSNAFRYELHFISQRSRLLVKDGLQATQNIFRIRFFHRLQQN